MRAPGFGEGARFLGSVSVTTTNVGSAGFSATLPVAVPPGQFVSATATDPNNNTSEFSRSLVVSAAATPLNLAAIAQAQALRANNQVARPAAPDKTQETIALDALFRQLGSV